MRENLQMVDGVSCILVQPLFLYESLWCLLVLMLLMMHLRRRVFQGEIFLRYLAGYGLGRFVIQWMRTDKVFFPGTEIDVSLVISGVLFVLCTVIVTVKIVMAKKRARVRKRRIEKDYQAEQQAAEQRKNATENLEREKNMSQNKIQIQQNQETLRKASLLQQLQEERKNLDSQIRSRSDLLKNLEASQRVDRILELYYQC